MKYDIEKALNITIPEEIKKIIEIKKRTEYHGGWRTEQVYRSFAG